jgi:hypothetical protein
MEVEEEKNGQLKHEREEREDKGEEGHNTHTRFPTWPSGDASSLLPWQQSPRKDPFVPVNLFD